MSEDDDVLFATVDPVTFLPPAKTVDALKSILGGAAAGQYVHIQGVPEALWIVTHNLGRDPAAVTVLDSAGTVVLGDVEYVPGGNSIILRFGAPFSGKAIIT